jgi:hypothetical protein
MHLLKCPEPRVAEVNLRLGMKMFYRMDAMNKFSGKVRPLMDWHPNIILTSGRNIMGDTSGWAGGGSYCHVGTSGTQPNAGESGLVSYVDGTNVIKAGSAVSGANGSEPYYGYDRRTYRFSPGFGGGDVNIQEAGVGWAASGSTLVSRVLVVNDFGDQAVASVKSDEYLDVTAEMRYYPPLTDVTGTVVLDGTTYNTTTRASEVTNGTAWGSRIGQAIGQYSVLNSDWQAYDGDLGTLLQAPNGTSAACDNSNQFNKTYINNSYQTDMQCDCGASGWNLGAGIRSIRIKTTAGNYQTKFEAQGTGNTVPKTSAYTMSMVWRIAWDEQLVEFDAYGGNYTIAGYPVTFTTS